MNSVLSPRVRKRGFWGERGMTLVELLVAMTISGILATMMFQFFEAQSMRFLQSKDHAEMQQELRWAMQFISEHIKLAGNAAPQILIDGKGRQIIENIDGPGGEPDCLNIIGSFRSVVVTLDQRMGNAGSQIKCSDKANDPPIPLSELFSVGDVVFISDGIFSELFQITMIHADHLWHQKSPPWNMSNQLQHRYKEESALTAISEYSFYIEEDEDARPNLMVDSLIASPQILAGDVEQLQVRFRMRNGLWQDTVDAGEINRNEVSQVEIYLRSRSREPIRGYRDSQYGDGYKRMELKTIVIPKNISSM